MRVALSTVVLVLVVLAGVSERAAAARDARVTVVYVSAWDCPYCVDWEATAQKAWEQSAERARVDYRVVKAPYFKRVDENRYWPEDIRWIRDKLQISRGTPRFIVVVDGAVVLHRFGTHSWDREVLPLVKKLVADGRGT